MAKRPRMGRNLDALLGGSTRERRTRTPASTGATATVSADADDAVAVIDRDVSGDAAADSTDDTASSDLTPSSVVAVEESPAPEPTPNEDMVPAPRSVAEKTTPAAIDATEHEVATAEMSTPSEEAATPTPTSLPVSDTLPAAPGHETARANAADAIAGTGDRFRLLGVDLIQRGNYQPRRLFDQELLQELADSIQAEGLIQPIIVRPLASGSDKGFELVAGERRWRAAQLAGMAEIPAIIRDMPDKSVAAVSVIENIQRKDLNPLEEAAAFERLCDEFGMTHKAVAESVGRSRAAVTNLMRLLELHDDVKKQVDRGELEMGHARALLGAPRDKQPSLAREIIEQGLSVRAVEKRIRELVETSDKPVSRKSDTVSDPDIERLSKKLGETLGATVKIQHKRTGRGKLEISYGSVAELQGILAHIK